MPPDPFGLAQSLSPVDLLEPSTPLPHPLRWTTMAIALAALTLGVLNAPAIRGWAYQLPPNAASARIVAAAEAYHDALDPLGLNRPVAAMHGWWQAFKALRFEGQASPGAPVSRSVRA